jgi:23S rRNA pseudouridine2457 synthase
MPRYIIFHKPYEVLSQFTDEVGRSTLKDYIPVDGVYAAGRLDFRSEGLLLLSDDGELIHRLTDPRFEHTKTYLAQVEGVVLAEALEPIRSGIHLKDLDTRPARVEIVSNMDMPPRSKPVRDYHPTTWLRIILKEGKKHQVRRMTAAIGYPTLRLVRVAIEDIQIGNLEPGDWRWITTSEVKLIKGSLGLFHTSHPPAEGKLKQERRR